jgi:hypothetical protein
MCVFTCVCPRAALFSIGNGVTSVCRWDLNVYWGVTGNAAGRSRSKYSTGRGLANCVTSLP